MNVGVSVTDKISPKIKSSEYEKSSSKKLSLSSSVSCLNLVKSINSSSLIPKGHKNESHPDYSKLINKRKS